MPDLTGGKLHRGIEAVLRRDRQIVFGALFLVCLGAWSYTLLGLGMGMTALQMTPGLSGMAPETSSGMGVAMSERIWTPGYALLMLAMWWVMMIAMMLPSAAPTILLAAAINRRSRADLPPFGRAGAFAAGYLLAWLGFSGLAVAAQWGLCRYGTLSSMMASASDGLTAGLLIAAGLWQLTSIKQVCRRHCRAPVHFLARYRGEGSSGALRAGLVHGGFCLGCCWFLMALLFVGGVMNLFWIAGLALFVLIEKLVPRGVRFGRISGLVLMAAGGMVLVL